jgi:hypothetical protein
MGTSSSTSSMTVNSKQFPTKNKETGNEAFQDFATVRKGSVWYVDHCFYAVCSFCAACDHSGACAKLRARIVPGQRGYL